MKRSFSPLSTLCKQYDNILLQDCVITVPKRSCGKVMFSQACVKNSVHREEVYTPPCADTPPRTDPPTQVDTLLGRHPHPIRRPLQRTVRILLECILVFLLHLWPHTIILYIYCPLTKCRKVMFLVVFVCLSIHGGAVHRPSPPPRRVQTCST